MGNIHVNQSIDPDRQILQYMSFYDLVDLLKFNQIFFTRADRPQRQGIFSKDVIPDLDSNSITLQSWFLPAATNQTEWEEHDYPQPRVCIVSSIRALSQSLFADDATRIYIELARKSDGAPDALPPLPAQRRRSKALPSTRPDSLYAIAISRRSPTANLSPAGMHLLVDLRTLLTGVIVPPNAPTRYMELVTKLVQESAWVSVTRATSSSAARVVSRLPQHTNLNTGP